MKKIIIAALFFVSLSFTSSDLFAQGPPDPPGNHGETTNQSPGGGAPIGGGIGILLTLGGVYGGRKLYQAWKSLDDRNLKNEDVQ